MDIRFFYVPSVVQIKNRGLFSTTVIEKKTHWSNYMREHYSINYIQVQYFVTIVSVKGAISAENEHIHMVALKGSLHTPIMLTYLYTTRREFVNKNRNIFGKLFQFQYGKVQNWYCYDHHDVDGNNDNRKWCICFEETFVHKE